MEHNTETKEASCCATSTTWTSPNASPINDTTEKASSQRTDLPLPTNPLDAIDLHPRLRERIVQTHPSPSPPKPPSSSYILYLPTVLLRMKHNPAFTLSAKLANYYHIPLIILAVLPDDHPHAMTSRRLAFTLEALSEAAPAWKQHGAGVFIRIHGPNYRLRDHLTLCTRAVAVVTDEPFVRPYLSFVQSVETACWNAGVNCFRVDGSTTVPPAAVLKRCCSRGRGGGTTETTNRRQLFYKGLPAKAWRWQKQTEAKRMGHVTAAMEGWFDAPPLSVKIDGDDFVSDVSSNEHDTIDTTVTSLLSYIPSSWRRPGAPSPGIRPWTPSTLPSNPKLWSLHWIGADSSVPPCPQTIGTHTSGMHRWNSWMYQRNGLQQYARRRNDPKQPHAPSRMSCYLNLGIVSIFELLDEVKVAQRNKIAGADKFEEEIVKWREFSYAHALSRGDYDGVDCVPSWARSYLDREVAVMESCGNVAKDSLLDRRSQTPNWKNAMPTMDQLENGTTNDVKWDAMQRYLVQTGELHNNARMTWGKTVVGWGKTNNIGSSTILQTLCHLNDRYALDGLSPPSYAGLLWCMGWTDTPGRNGEIRKKLAKGYKIGPEGFREAERVLMKGVTSGGERGSTIGGMFGTKRRHEDEERTKSKKQRTVSPAKRTICSYFMSESKSSSNTIIG